jgi:predicted DNA-binding transcriptional regulator AlpA
MNSPQRNARDDDDEAIDTTAVLVMLDVSVMTLWRKVRAGELPKPFYPAARSPRWIRGEIRAARERLRMTPTEAKEAHRQARLRKARQETDVALTQ